MGSVMDREVTRLNLAYQDLEEIPSHYLHTVASHIKELDLSYNRIRDLKFLSEFTVLDTLILDRNGLTSHMKLPCLPSLSTLWLNNNKISNIGIFITMLQSSCPKLRYLSMMNNPAAPSYFNNSTAVQNKDYRDFVISQLRYLEGLDDKVITMDDRAEAERIYKNMPKLNKNKSKNTKNEENRSLLEKYQDLLPDFQEKENKYLELLPDVEELTNQRKTVPTCNMNNNKI